MDAAGGSPQTSLEQGPRLDDGGEASAERIVPELLRVAPADVMPAVPGATDVFVVDRAEEPRDLVGHRVMQVRALRGIERRVERTSGAIELPGER